MRNTSPANEPERQERRGQEWSHRLSAGRASQPGFAQDQLPSGRSGVRIWALVLLPALAGAGRRWTTPGRSPLFQSGRSTLAARSLLVGGSWSARQARLGGSHCLSIHQPSIPSGRLSVRAASPGGDAARRLLRRSTRRAGPTRNPRPCLQSPP